MKFNAFSVFIPLALAISCGGDSGGGGSSSSSVTPSSAISASTLTVDNSVATIGALAPASAETIPQALLVGTWWDDASVAQLCDERNNCSSQVSGADYMAVQLDPDAVRANGSSIGIFGRLRSGLGIICALGEALPASAYTGNNINNGNYTVTFTAADAARVKSICHLDVAEADTVSMTVTTNSSTTLYDRTVNLCFDNSGSCSNPEQKFMYKVTDSTINIASLETSDSGGNGPYFSRLLLKMDITNDTLAVEYVSAFVGTGAPNASNERIEVRRLYKTATEGLVMYSSNGSVANEGYGVKGNIVNTAAPVELAYQDSNTSYLEGSFIRSSGVFTTSNISGADFTNTTTLVNNLYGSYNSSNYYNSSTLAMSDTIGTNFTSFAQVFSAALPQ